MRTPRPLLALAAAAFLAACPAPAAAPPPAGSPAGGAEPLVTTLQVETSADSLRFSLAVTNAGAAPVTLEFPTSQRYDFAVLDGARELWRWSADCGFAQALGTETLAPGQTRTWTEAWRPDAALRGRQLTAVGTLASSSHRVERRSPVRVP
jgi:hypothetical protein